MKRLTEKQSRHSLTTQVVIWVVGFVSVLFVTALLIMFHHARESIYQEAMEKARQTLRTTELRIDNTLNEVETATRSMHWTIEKRLRTRYLSAIWYLPRGVCPPQSSGFDTD